MDEIKIDDIKKYFEEKKFAELGYDKLRHLEFKPSLAFTDGKNRIFINIMPIEALSKRNSFIRFIIETSILREHCEQIYIVIPKILATIVDSEMMKSIGVGILVYDGKKLSEIAPAQLCKPKVILDVEVVKNIEDILNRLSSLETAVEELSLYIEKIAEEIREFRALKVTVTQEAIKKAVKLEVKTKNLPSYFENNPWLDILSKRGQPSGAED